MSRNHLSLLRLPTTSVSMPTESGAYDPVQQHVRDRKTGKEVWLPDGVTGAPSPRKEGIGRSTSWNLFWFNFPFKTPPRRCVLALYLRTTTPVQVFGLPSPYSHAPIMIVVVSSLSIPSHPLKGKGSGSIQTNAKVEGGCLFFLLFPFFTHPTAF